MSVATAFARSPRRASARWGLLPLSVVLLGMPGPAHGVEITLSNAWMRPAYAGEPTLEAYVDITTDAPLRLAKVSTPAARAVEIVVLDKGPQGAAVQKVVKSFPVPAGTPTRFALHGNILRLKAIRHALDPAQTVPLTFQFVDAKGRKHTASTDALVRGIFPKRRPEAAASAAGATPAAAPATGAPASERPPASAPAAAR